MGFFSSLFSIFYKKKALKLIVVGLDNSGKSTLINWIKPKKNAKINLITPTVGYNIEQFEKNNIDFTIFDMSGQSRYRDMWQTYCKNIDGIIFVIDSADIVRFAVVCNELDAVLQVPDIKNSSVPIIFFANKMDLPQAASPADFVDLLKLKQLTNRSWHIEASNALSGEGIEEGFKWLSTTLESTIKK